MEAQVKIESVLRNFEAQMQAQEQQKTQANMIFGTGPKK